MNDAPFRAVPGIARFAVLSLLFVSIVGLAFVIWRASDLLILVFGSIVVSVVLRSATRPIAAHTGLGEGWSFGLAVLVIVGLLAVVVWLVGGPVVDQMNAVFTQLPQAWAEVQRWLEQHRLGRLTIEGLRNVVSGGAASRLAGFAATAFGGIADAFVLVVLSIFFGTNPSLYRRGFLRLIPPHAHDRVVDALDASARALQKWLLGKGIAMLGIGLLTGIGLWLLGVPMALALGVLAGLLEFVPFLGPLLAAIPAVLVAFLQSPSLALYTAGLFLLIQNAEGYAIEPMVQRWAVSIPPALTVIAVLLFGLLFGILGIIFATPLMVVTLVLVRKLYVEGALGRS